MSKQLYFSPELIMLGVFFVLVSSCTKITDYEANEQQEIKTYLTTRGDTEKPNSDGLYYFPVAVGTGDPAKNNDWILFTYDAYYLESGKLFDSTDTTLARENGITPTYILGGPVKAILQGSYSWLEGFLNMREGGKATFIVPSNLWNYDYQPRLFNVSLIKVIPDLRAYEISQIDTFIDSLNLSYKLNITPGDSSKSPISGIYYIETQPGSGKSPASLNTVNVTYTMKLLDGRIIGQYNDVSFTLGIGVELSAFEQGIEQMKAGSSGYIIIPYHSGYNNQVLVDQNNDIVVQGYSTLVYQVSLNGVQ